MDCLPLQLLHQAWQQLHSLPFVLFVGFGREEDELYFRHPNGSLHWYCVSRRCASCPQALSHTSVPSPRPLSSTQLVIHLSRPCPAAAPRSAAAPQPRRRGALGTCSSQTSETVFSLQPLLPMPLTLA